MRAQRHGGFTLLELLAALAVLAVLAALSFRGLASILDAEAHVREESRRWSDVGLVLAQLREDLASAAGARGLALNAEGAALALTRFPELAGAAPRRVGYRLRGRTLEYLVWPAASASESAAAVYPVLSEVVELRVSALGEDGAWTVTWPSAAASLPRAVAVELVLGRGERVTRLYPLR